MFTGLVRATGSVREAQEQAEGRRLVIEVALEPADRAIGASVCTSGVCLTVVEADEGSFAVEAAFETLRLTTLGDLKVGDRVNLEPSLRMGDAIGGHLVSGHVDGIGELRRIEPRGEARECWFAVPPDLRRFVAVKGSVCVDGVSLTINAVEGDEFMVGLIPHTLEVTTLGILKPGDRVNLEVDQLARYGARNLEVEAAEKEGAA